LNGLAYNNKTCSSPLEKKIPLISQWRSMHVARKVWSAVEEHLLNKILVANSVCHKVWKKIYGA
jgi:hypothetical protein